MTFANYMDVLVRRWLTVVICLLLAVSLLLAVPSALLLAQDKAGDTFDSKARQAILIDARTGRVLYEKDADTPIPPASMSKLMTMIMVFEALKAGKMKLDQEILVSEDAWRRGGARHRCPSPRAAPSRT